jgi:glycerophosphoryl diester phosphodiesterase
MTGPTSLWLMASRPYLAHPPLALAHRGGALFAPNIGLENTMTAFRNAVEMGYTHIETDVHLTRDGHLVAFHDDRLDRVSDRTGLIRDLTLEEIRAARLSGPQGDERVPLLVDVLDELPGTRLNIDLKAPGTADALWRLVEERRLHDLVCVGSFSQRSVSRFRWLARGSVATAAGQVGTGLLRFSPGWLSRLLHTRADVLQVPTDAVLRGRPVEVVTQGLVRAAHRLGKQVHVWTIDEAEDMHRLLDLGVDGLVSDRIDVLKEVMLERGTWTGA